jgi:4-cresol dehydrogenase (hydroxylating) flavoprotein subunit
LNTSNPSVAAAFSQVVGETNVITDPDTLHNYGQTTFKTSQTVRAVVLPANVEEVQACLRIARELKVNIYPISTGLNTGYGDRVPMVDDSVILELRRMNRIVDFNEELAYVTLEPGVTQQQLYDFIQEKKANLWMDCTGSYTGHSIIGNIAERGSGHTAYADHFSYVGGMEVVLPDGQLLRTGFGRFENARAEGVFRAGVGPCIEGLFTQSNLGVITQVTLWLMPRPEYTQQFFCKVPAYEDVGPLIDALRPLRLNGTIRSAMHIGNDYRMISSTMRYPWERSGDTTPLPRDLLEELSRERDYGAWNVTGALYGTRAEVALARKQLKRAVQPVCGKVRFIDDRLLRIAERFQGLYHKLTGINLPEMLSLLKPVYGMTQGKPSDGALPGVYWRKTIPVPKTPAPLEDRCGLLWITPMAPTGGQFALEVWSIVERIMLAHGFEPGVTITLLTERAMDIVISIMFDRELEGEDERALACHDELLADLIAAGYYPYRLSLRAMDQLPPSAPGYSCLLGGVKDMLDPGHRLAPGRYIP